MNIYGLLLIGIALYGLMRGFLDIDKGKERSMVQKDTIWFGILILTHTTCNLFLFDGAMRFTLFSLLFYIIKP